MSTPYRVLGSNHTSFTVTDVEASVGFFRECLGYELKSLAVPGDPEVIGRVTGVPGAVARIAYLRGPGHVVELLQYLQPEGREAFRPRPCDTGFAHLALDVDGIDALVDASKKFGFNALGRPVDIPGGPNKGKKAVYLRGGDGLTLELIGT